MWHEARKQEKKLRGILVDHKKRAERRKIFYDKIKKDPAEFLQIWGRQCKIHIDANVASAADNPSIMTTWPNDKSLIIDRFDARAHLDVIDENGHKNEAVVDEKADLVMYKDASEMRACIYERYRNLVFNDTADLSEEQCLKQIELDEKYGPATGEETKKPKEPKAAIPLVYEDSTHPTFAGSSFKKSGKDSPQASDQEDDEDLDLLFDFNKLDGEQKQQLNKYACNYGIKDGEFVRMLRKERDEKEMLKAQKALEVEKAQYSGRKSRRERRMAKDKRLIERGLGPLSYKAVAEGDKKSESDGSGSGESRRRLRSRSTSRSRSKSVENKIVFISSFGGANSDEEKNLTGEEALKLFNETLKKKNSLSTLKALQRDLSMSPPMSRFGEASHGVGLRKAAKIEERLVNGDSSDASLSSKEDEFKEYLKRKQERLALQAREITSELSTIG